jgi:hypothetical protein
MFSLYNFVQTLNSEIDTMKEAELQVEHEISTFKQQAREQEEHRLQLLNDLQSRVQKANEEHDSMLERNHHEREAVQQISKKIQSVFFKLQCDQMDSKSSQNQKEQAVSSSSNTKGATVSRPETNVAWLTSQGVTESNVLDFLGCIEQRSVDIIGEYLRLKASEGGANLPRSPTPGPSSPLAFPVKMEPIMDFNDIADEDFLDTEGEGENKLVDLNMFKKRLMKKVETSARK